MYKHFCYSVCFCQSFDTMAQFICLKTWQKSAPLHFLICCSLQFPTTISFWDLTSCFTGLSFTFIAYIESFYIIRNATQLCIAYLQSSEQYRFKKAQVNSYPGQYYYIIIIIYYIIYNLLLLYYIIILSRTILLLEIHVNLNWLTTPRCT